MSKKMGLAIVALVSFCILTAAVWIGLGNQKGEGFNIIDNQNSTELSDPQVDDFFVLSDNLSQTSINITDKINGQLMSNMENKLELGDFAHFFTFYIPTEMSHILAAYHYENLNRDTYAPYNEWSEEYYENEFMSNTGNHLYDLYLQSLTENTLVYGFIPMNSTVHNSVQLQKLYIKNFSWIYN